MVSGPFPRFAAAAVADALGDTPVVVIQGARQVGKSTLTQMVTADRAGTVRSTLDDPATLAVADADPTFFIEQAGHGTLLIDEAQRSPGLILPLKASVDRDRQPGRFLLTGSADLLEVKGVGDSLAGRAETIELKPLSQGELAHRSTAEDFVTWVTNDASGRGSFSPLDPTSVLAGGYPEAVQRMPQRAQRWFESYVDRLADHDARDLHQGGYSIHLRRLLNLVAAGGQQELAKAKSARALDIAEGTLNAYLRLAHTMRLVETLPAWGRSQRGRIVKRPKLSLNDTGLAASLTQFTPEQASTIGGREYYGSLVEQFVALELIKQSGWTSTRSALHHFRDLDGLEVDIVAELGNGGLVAIEVKSASSVNEKSWANLVRFKDRFADRNITGVCLHTGTQVARLNDWLHVLPITSLWQH